MELDCINDELDRVDAKLAMLTERRRELAEKRRVILSQKWIEVNACKRVEVEFTEFEGDFWRFALTLKSKESPKRFTAWDGKIYLTAEFVHGKMQDTDGYVSELKV